MLALLVPCIVSALLCFPFAAAFYDALGQLGLIVIAILVALTTTTLAPALASLSGRGPLTFAKSLLALALLLLIGTLLTPGHSPASPEQLNLALHVDADSGSARWIAPSLPASLTSRAQWTDHTAPLYPWNAPGSAHVFTAPAPAFSVTPPDAKIESDTRTGEVRTVVIRVQTRRGASRIGLAFHSAAPVQKVIIDGWELKRLKPARAMGFADGWRRVSIRAPADGTSRIELKIRGEGSIDGYALDWSNGLPQSGTSLANARNAAAVQSSDGDVTVVTHRLLR